jgi:hypothetical protein
MLEEAIVISGANDDGRKIFQIGVNCEADNSFNKDPKEPNKYEQEGQKLQFDVMAMIEYYVKMIGEHPLLTYFEDAFSIYDFAGHREFRNRLSNEFPNVTMSLKYLFSKGGLKRMKAITDFSDFGMQAQEGDPASRCDSRENPPGSAAGVSSAVKGKGTPMAAAPGAKKVPVASGGTDTPAGAFPEFDPSDPNKYKVTPDCASIEMSSVLTMSQMLQFFVHA